MMVTGLINIITTPNNQGINWAEWISVILTFFTTIATIATAIIAGIALDSWKKEIDYKNIISIKKELIKVLIDYFYSLNLHFDYMAESDQKNRDKKVQFDYKTESDRIKYELSLKNRELEKNINMYLFYNNKNIKTFEKLQIELNNYYNKVLGIIDVRVKCWQSEIELKERPTELAEAMNKAKPYKISCDTLVKKAFDLLKE